MLFSGYTYRSISDQTGTFGFGVDLTVSNTSRCTFGFSGTRNFEFTLVSGEIFDPNNNFVGGYEAGQSVNISGQIRQNRYDYFINGAPVGINQHYNNGFTGTQVYSSWYVNPQSGVTGDLDFNVYGVLPSYSIQGSGNYLASGSLVTGNVINLNPSVHFRIFDVQIEAQQTPFFVTGFTTGDISTSGQFYLGCTQAITSDTSIPLRFYTNFGQIDVQYLIGAQRAYYTNVYLSMTPENPTVSNGDNFFTAYLANYPNEADISVSLKYISGQTGNIYHSVSTINTKSLTISGVVTGAQALVTYYQGPVTGYDPLLNINVSGSGSGYLYTNIVLPTGLMTYNYVLLASGLGAGTDKGSTLAYAQATSDASGDVGILGGYSAQKVFTNMSGYDQSGNFVGIISYATGQVYLYPTGYFRLSEPLTYGYAPSGQYVSGELSVSKVYEGWLYTDYSLISVGYATGASGSGIVDSKFLLNFEPGYYVFSKHFSGTITGHRTSMADFNPAVCEQVVQINSGELQGTFTWPSTADYTTSPYTNRSGGYLDCIQATGLPTITVSGLPVVLYNATGGIIPPYTVTLVLPHEGFAPTETSDNALSGDFTRTKTSRMGSTPSGYGYFNQVVNECVDLSNNSGIWREALNTYMDEIENNPLHTHLNYLASDFLLSGSNVTGFGSGIMTFTISGDQPRDYVFRGLSPSSTNDTAISLYHSISYPTYAQGSVYLPYLVTGDVVSINAQTFIYQTGSGFTGNNYFTGIVNLRDKLNTNVKPAHVSGFFSGDANLLYLFSTTIGTSGNSFALSGTAPRVMFSSSTLTGGYNSGTVRNILIYDNKGWNYSSYDTSRMLNENGLKPSSSNDSAIGIRLQPGDYTLKIIETPIQVSRGTLQFSTGVYSGCENWGYIPLTIIRNGGTFGNISGVVNFATYGAEIATSGVDFDATPIPFYIYGGQTSTTVGVPVYYKGLAQKTYDQFTATLTANYDPDGYALSGINTATVLIYPENKTGLCNTTIPITPIIPVPPVYYPPFLPGPIISNHGDTHIEIFNSLMGGDYHLTPFNIDDNSTQDKVLWFYAEDFEGNTYKVEYDQMPYTPVIGGLFISNVYITTNTRETVLSGYDILNQAVIIDLGGFLTLELGGGSSSDCLNDIFIGIGMNSIPTNKWYQAKKLGGVFYYLLKQAARMGAGPINNYAAGGWDGISAFLRPLRLTRYDFEQASSSGDVSQVSETPLKSTIVGITIKWNEFNNIKGFFEGNWDPSIMPCSKKCWDLSDSQSVTPSGPTCQQTPYFTQTYTNPFDGPAKVEFSGTVDDVLLYNGEEATEGAVPGGGGCNQAHDVPNMVRYISAGESFTLGAADNYFSVVVLTGRLCITKLN